MDSLFQRAHQRVVELLDHFQAHADVYRSAGYQEAETRKDFIDPFLKALGWDVDHEREHNPYEQEVKVERGVSIARSQKRADYAFYLTPNFRDVRFFVEAKKPSVDLSHNIDAHFQTLRYGYSANTPLAVLTDFDNVLVLDCRRRPHPDSALECVHAKWKSDEFRDAARFAEFYWLFSREAHEDGSYFRRIEELPKPRGGARQRGLFKGGYQPVDASFLAELEEHRATLAKEFKRSNPTLDSQALTETVQRTLDRLVFLRFLEDKQIETDIHVSDFGKGKGAWADFQTATRRLDNIYNGIVFKRLAPMDDPGFVVDDDIFADICERLSAENSPYNFDAIPIHILGSIYERFLGSVIRATAQRAFVEEKPEVRKAGGVYYTPEYVVRHIVEETVGVAIAGKTPAQISLLRFADIACGSGSFLLGVFDALLRKYADWYNKPGREKQAKKDGCVRTEDGRWRLSLAQRRSILQNNIFGVDVDPQAVEVAQLSLFLKLLEDERATSKRQYQLDYARDANLKKVLPDLSGNVACGNTLIGWDVLGFGGLDPEDERRLNPLDFESAFPAVMRAGGFDAIVGNPPYVRPKNLDTFLKTLLWDRFETYTKKADLYCCFIEKATRLLKNGGRLSYILSKGWMQLDSFHELRLHLLANYSVEALIEIPFRVFEDAAVDTAIFIAKKEADSSARAQNVIRVESASRKGKEADFCVTRTIPQSEFSATYKNVFDTSITPASALIKSRMSQGVQVGDVFDVSFGLKTGDDSKFIHKEAGKHREDKPLLRGEDVFRYGYSYADEYVWYVPTRMRAHRQTARPGTADRFEQPKILVKDTTKDFGAAIDHNGYYVKDVLVLTARSPANDSYPLELVLALLNSKLMKFFYRTTFPTLHVQNGELASLPLPNLQREGMTVVRDRIVSLVAQLVATAEAARSLRDGRDGELAKRKFAALDRQIDELVYHLYGIPSEDIALIEETVSAL